MFFADGVEIKKKLRVVHISKKPFTQVYLVHKSVSI